VEREGAAEEADAIVAQRDPHGLGEPARPTGQLSDRRFFPQPAERAHRALSTHGLEGPQEDGLAVAR
jgi:hypothetical protein